MALAVVFFRLQQVGPVNDATRAFNKRVTNPAMMKLAGRRHWYVSAIRHTGRRSGREYGTPVWALPTSDGFIISLPFGEGVDWLKNVLAASRATIKAKGETWAVIEPEVVDREVAVPLLPRHAWLLFELAGIKRYLKARRLFESPSATVDDGGTRSTVGTPG